MYVNYMGKVEEVAYLIRRGWKSDNPEMFYCSNCGSAIGQSKDNIDHCPYCLIKLVLPDL